jgi:hypothetical protein
LEPSRKEKRVRFSRKHRSDGARLTELLRQHQQTFPSFKEQLEEFIDRVTTFAERNRLSDREKVLEALREWEFGLTAKELVEDTGLSHWDVRMIVADLIRSGLVVEKRELRPGNPRARYQEMHSKQWCIAYRLK